MSSQHIAESGQPDPFAEAVAQCETRRRYLLEEGRLSVPKAAGALAIIVSGANLDGTYHPGIHSAFMEEAEQAQERHRRKGGYSDVAIIPEATQTVLERVLADPDIAGLVIISHGNIGAIYTTGGRPSYWWNDVAKAATHLKRGEIEQAVCGLFPHQLGSLAALGTFAVERLSSVRAAAGAVLPDESFDHSQVLRPIYDDVRPLDEQLAVLNARHRGVKAIINSDGEITRVIKQSCQT